MSPLTELIGGAKAYGWGILQAPTSFESIATHIRTSSSTSAVEFTNIPQTYEHLQLRISGRFGSNGHLRLNSDANSNYNYHYLAGNGTSASTFWSEGTINRMLAWGSGNNDGTYPQSIICDLLDYRNTDKFKTARFLWAWDKNGSGNVWTASGLWRSTSAVNAITIDANESTIYAGAHFALYGIKGVV